MGAREISMSRPRVGALRAQDLTHAATARRLGLSVSRVWRLRRRLGLPRNAPPAGFRRTFDKEAVRRLNLQGMNKRQVAFLNATGSHHRRSTTHLTGSKPYASLTAE